jgi:hypothetical protein
MEQEQVMPAEQPVEIMVQEPAAEQVRILRRMVLVAEVTAVAAAREVLLLHQKPEE